MSDENRVLGDDPLDWMGQEEHVEQTCSQDNAEGADMADKNTKREIIDLPEQFTIAEVGQVHSRLISSLKDCDEVCLKAGGVKKADAASLQLLVALISTAEENHMELVWDGVSDSLRQSAEIAGLTDALSL